MDREGINIPREVADEESVPEDLDANLTGEYVFPDPRRRRIAGAVYLLLAAGLAVAATRMTGLAVGAGLLALLGAWHLWAAWPRRIDERQALDRAAAHVAFPVGHASAAMTFHGVRARPRWQVILYSADEPPSRRALVEVDAVSGTVSSEVYVEDVPRD